MDQKAARFVQATNARSVIQFSHPLTAGGFVVLLRSNASDYLEQIALAYQTFTEGTLYCVRPDELFQLWQPGVFVPPFHVNELPHLPYCLRYNSALLAGADVSTKIRLPHYDRRLVVAHIEACRDSLRRYGILSLLFEKKYEKLHALLRREVHLLMASALLARQQWNVSLQAIDTHFAEWFPDKTLNATAVRLMHQNQDIESQQSAYNAVYSFEQFLSLLEESV